MQNLYGCLSKNGSPLPDNVCVAPTQSSTIGLSGGQIATSDGLSCAIRGWMSYGGLTGCSPEIAAMLLAAYRDNGLDFLKQLKGSFAVVITDTKKHAVFAAVDRMGQQSISYGDNGNLITLGSSAKQVAHSLERQSQLNRQAIYDYMLSHMVSAPDTVYTGVRKLLAGHYLRANSEGISVQRYWEPAFEADRNIDPEELRESVLTSLQQAIEAGSPSPTSGSFLSGGLDSSTVTGLLARSEQRAVPAFSVGFGVKEFDELEFARIAAKRFGNQHIEYNVTPADIVELVPKIAAAYDEPFGNSSAIPTFCCARVAKEHGIDHLYAGDGGDELFGGNERYLRQRVFEYYQRIPRVIRDKIISPIASKFDPDEGWLPLQKFASYVRQASDPLPERFESWNLIYREGAANVFSADFLDTVDTQYPLEKMRATWESCPSDDLLDKMLWYDWKYTLADSDLPKVSHMCELAGVRVSYPMLDDDFVKLSMRIPTAAKIENSQLRSFYKKAVTGFLPPEILTKAKHGFGLPFGIWLKTDKSLQDLVYGTLDALRTRNIFSREFIDRVASEHRSGHAGYYGYAIWDLVMLEQWLQTHNQHMV